MLAAAPALACDAEVSVCGSPSEGAFQLIHDGKPVAVLVDADADPAVIRVVRDLTQDLARVSGSAPSLQVEADDPGAPVVIVGVLGESALVDDLVARGLVDVSGIKGQWEAFVQQVVNNPREGVDQALVIVGSDRRGAIYGAYDLSERIGVSPWYWWADVPVVEQDDLYLTAGLRQDRPGVRYRGFFINDEDPALSGWAKKQFGGVNAAMYEHMFELLLRLKGNYIWPAMWGKSIAEDDPNSLALAADMGVVLGTSHHEPLTRAHVEWDRAKAAGEASGDWNYATNREVLRQFWRAGMERFVASGGEAVVTIGMRGDGDEAMSEDTAIPLLEQVVADQRQIIADVTGKAPEETPQVWALYKEVQDYYDQGMRVPDDVILLFADDNWGQVRRLPPADAAPRKGGYGVYYHFDYVGGPRSYKWLNYNQVAKVWQQMDLAWQRGARDLWIVNVGDLKPMEIPLTFFMEQAWNPETMTLDAAKRWPQDWAARTFGTDHASEIARLITDYSRLAARRKPELIDPDSFTIGELVDGKQVMGEFDEMNEEWFDLARRTQAVGGALDREYGAAYFELVAHPVLALENLYRMYRSVAWNRVLAAKGDARANLFADIAEGSFEFDRQLTEAYHSIMGGKWDGMINQTHIGYTSWDDPDQDVMPKIERIATELTAEELAATLGELVPGTVSTANVGLEMDTVARANREGPAWTFMPDLGRTSGALVSYPQGLPATTIEDAVRVDFPVELAGGPTKVALYLSATLDTQDQGGLRVGVSLDDGPVQVLVSTLEPTNDPADNQDKRDWEIAVKDNAHVLTADFGEVDAGEHVLKLWRIDDNVVVQRIGIGPDPTGGRYLGPPAQ